MLNYTDNYLSQENEICYCINNNHDNFRLAFSPYSDYTFLQKCLKDVLITLALKTNGCLNLSFRNNESQTIVDRKVLTDVLATLLET